MPERPAAWSVYVHFPFCLHRCAYCDFATVAAREIPRERYLAAVLAELQLRARTLPAAPIATVFFGGGTPSLWGPAAIGDILGALDRWGPLQRDAEITLEANPGTTALWQPADYAAVGVSRLSVGVQALDDQRLRALDRRHDRAGALQTLRQLVDLLAAGRLQSASGDLIFGGPGQTLADLEADLVAILALGLPHLSAYGLTIEPGTPLAERIARGLAVPPDEALQSEMLARVPEVAARYGLARYEVSNFAQPGHQSRHNLVYWRGGSYLALGVSAHGFVAPAHPGDHGERWGNLRDNDAWLAAIEAGDEPVALRERIEPTDHVDELLLTGLRLAEGVDLDHMAARVGPQLRDNVVELARRAIARRAPLRLDDLHGEPIDPAATAAPGQPARRLVVLDRGIQWLDAVILDLLTG